MLLWYNKQADWPTDEGDNVRRESQTEDDGMKEGRLGEVEWRRRKEQDGHTIVRLFCYRRKGTKSCGRE